MNSGDCIHIGRPAVRNASTAMWRLMKHRWMEAKRRTQEELERAVEHVFEHFGSQFKMEF